MSHRYPKMLRMVRGDSWRDKLAATISCEEPTKAIRQIHFESARNKTDEPIM